MGMVALLGTPEDYDDWQAQGTKGWDDVRPFFNKLESYQDFSGKLHCLDGPVPIRRPSLQDIPPMAGGVARLLPQPLYQFD